MKSYLITGGTGSWGNVLTQALLMQENTEEIRIFSRNEYLQVTMERKFNNPKLKFILGDVRDYDTLELACRGVDTIFHLAAIKHIPIAEEQPLVCIRTNIFGTDNVIKAALENKVSKVVYVSTDKACNPNTLYGATKLIGERLIINANKLRSTEFVCVRAGNVIGSNGSVIPFFIQRIREGRDVGLTEPDMTRFYMSLPEAIELLLEASNFSLKAELFVMKMPSCKIGDLLEVLVNQYGKGGNVAIRKQGLRKNEKMHELLLNEYEAVDAYEYGKYYVVVRKEFLSLEDVPLSRVKFQEYGSNTQELLSLEEIEELLKRSVY